jgi:hypothetical protein
MLGSQKKYISKDAHKTFFMTIDAAFEDRYKYTLTVDSIDVIDENMVITCIDIILFVAKLPMMHFSPPVTMCTKDRFIVANFVEKYLMFSDDPIIVSKLEASVRELFVAAEHNPCATQEDIFNYILFNDIRDNAVKSNINKMSSQLVVRAFNDLLEAVSLNDVIIGVFRDQIQDYLDVEDDHITIPVPHSLTSFDTNFIVKFHHCVVELAQRLGVGPKYVVKSEEWPEAIHCMTKYKIYSDRWLREINIRKV